MVVASKVLYFYFRSKHIMPHKIITVSSLEIKNYVLKIFSK